MRKRGIVLIAGGCIALASVNVAFAAVPSTTSIAYNQSTENFHGMVHSSDAECVAGLRFKVYKQTASGPALQGRVTSNAQGGWKIEVMHAQGHYFAVAPKQRAMHTHCGRARSHIVDVM
jgi:hypothetical protein